MAIEKTKESIGLKMTLNYIDMVGKSLSKSKTYGDVKMEVTDATMYATAVAISKMQEPVLEKVVSVTAESLIEIV